MKQRKAEDVAQWKSEGGACLNRTASDNEQGEKRTVSVIVFGGYGEGGCIDIYIPCGSDQWESQRFDHGDSVNSAVVTVLLTSKWVLSYIYICRFSV